MFSKHILKSFLYGMHEQTNVIVFLKAIWDIGIFLYDLCSSYLVVFLRMQKEVEYIIK